MSTYQKAEYWRDRYQRLKATHASQLPVDPMTQFTDLDWSYLAGLIDGEGSITLGMNRNRIHVPSIDVIMTYRPVIEWLSASFGTSMKTRPSRNARHAASYHWRIQGHRAVNVCVLLLPYLRVKRAQADVLARFGETYSDIGWERSLSDERRSIRESLDAELHLLNSKGPKSSEFPQ